MKHATRPNRPRPRKLAEQASTRLEGRTVAALNDLARRLGLPRSEILRRALQVGLAAGARDPRALFDAQDTNEGAPG